MFIECIINLRRVDTKLEDLGLPSTNDVQHSSPMLVNINNIETIRPYMDADGIPDSNYSHLTMVSKDAMLVLFNFNDLKNLLKQKDRLHYVP